MAKKKRKQTASTIQNRRARHDYQLSDSLVAGIALSGREARALRQGHGQLRGAYVTVKDEELWLINATITGDRANPITESEQTQARKVLVKQREIQALVEAKREGKTIVPLELLTHGRYIKLRLAIGKGKKNYDKRQTLKQRAEQRTINRALKFHRS
jgi:SsrA-binding protein